MSKEKKFANILKLDSPKLYGELGKMFGTLELEKFEDLYAERCNIYKIEEENINRTIGSNYNPKPCRILLLQVRDAFSKKLELFHASLFSDLNSENIEKISQENLKNSVKKNIKIVKNLDSHNEEIETLTFASLLDEIRHWHLTKEKSLKRLNNLLSYLNSFRSENNQALQNKCIHALKLQGLKF